MTKKEAYHGSFKKRRKIDSMAVKEGSNEAVLLADVRHLLAAQAKLGGDAQPALYSPPERFSEVEVKITELSSTGDGLGLSSALNHVYAVPFTAPGDVVRAKVITYYAKDRYTLTDFVKIVEPSAKRDDSLVRCSYFATCSGCQFQMLSYGDQLTHKKTIIEKAFKNFSGLAPELVPSVRDTIGSPSQYGYRTKLTPHFNGPPGSHSRKDRRNGVERKGFQEVPPIGFMTKGTGRTMDIEDCPIGTETVRRGMQSERQRVAEELSKYKRGATLLLRESTTRTAKEPPNHVDPIQVSENESQGEQSNGDTTTSITVEDGHSNTRVGHDDVKPYVEVKTCITDPNATSTEYVDNFVFSNTAGAFFQNNNSILPRFTAYIREHILPATPGTASNPIKYLIDAYSGSGLFTVTLSSLFSSSTGIDISAPSIASANENAKANHVSNASFIAAEAATLFRKVTYPPAETVVVIDPPRKGCNDGFLPQLLEYGPRRIVYVSCNVHTQARDIGVLVAGKGGFRYEMESLQGFDFFPQTSHVESVAILNRSEPSEAVAAHASYSDVFGEDHTILPG
ncbi:MAG: hypothetical protein LQ347_005915 [Umbilicaria vellea]|nr:MAG: hypothetical protein LQ347_005915 [Umbilicaria vellea]